MGSIIQNYKAIISILGVMGTISATLIGLGQYQGEYKAKIETEDKYESTIYNNTVLGALVDYYGRACPELEVDQFKELLQPTGDDQAEEE